jgi:hypothetical protein
MQNKMIELTGAEKVLYQAQFEFWYTIAGLDCAAANAKAYEKIINTRKISKELKKQGYTH